MPSTTQSPTFTKSGFDALLGARAEPAWVTQQRRTAWAMFEEKPWPSRSETASKINRSAKNSVTSSRTTRDTAAGS